MVLLKLIQLLIGVIFTYMGFQMRIRHNYSVLRGFAMKRNYSGLSRGYARRAGRIFLFGGVANLLIAIAMLVFARIEDTAPVGTAHYVVFIGFAVGVAGLMVAILINELYNLRKYGER